MTRVAGDWLDRPATQAVCRMLEQAGHRALFVGGCVRDALIGRAVGDIDISTDARPQDVVALAGTAGFKAVPTGIDHGTVTIVAGGIPHEVTTFRRDVETDGRRAVVAFSDDVEEDARRRDFTMNALYADARGNVIDPLGEGLADLSVRRIRFIEDPETRIREDYLRILRFFRFHAWYGDPDAGMDAEALAAISTLAEGLDHLSAERIGHEMRRLLAAPDPAPAVAAMRQTGVLAHVLPGADDRALAPLVHLEGLSDTAPDAMRRLAVLGAHSPADRLRLSRAEAKHLDRIAAALADGSGPEVLGYRHGAEAARDAVLILGASTGQPPSPDDLEAVRRGAERVLPVVAADLMPAYKGAALGARLKEIEARWLASGFTLTRDELLRES